VRGDLIRLFGGAPRVSPRCGNYRLHFVECKPQASRSRVVRIRLLCVRS
jgi:hypothetical protein